MAAVLAPGLARKVKKVLDSKVDSPELTKSLKELSLVYPENTPAARRALRSTIEHRGIKINEEFLRVAEAAQNALELVEAQLEGLSQCCTSIESSLQASRTCTSELVAETTKLKRELGQCDQRRHMVNSFLADYQLSAAEVSALREGDVSDAFFAALEHVRDIHQSCKTLLRTHNQRAGLELMDVMAMHQEAAYERLCRWVQQQCRSLVDNDSPDLAPFLRRAAASLRARPTLFKYCAEEVAGQRHAAVFRRFIAALTRGGPGGTPRPMEMHAHDPRRYAGDMLAWLHQALASEHELMDALFGAEHNDAGGERTKPIPAGGEELWDTKHILDIIFEGVCRPFKVRVEQVLTTVPGSQAPSALLTFRLTALLSFYLDTVKGFVAEKAAVCVAIGDCRALAQRTLFDVLKAKGCQLTRHPPVAAKDLAPPPVCAQQLNALLELLHSPDASMLPEEEAAGRLLGPIVDAVVDPLVVMCAKSADALKGAGAGDGFAPWASAVLQINCLAALAGPLEPFAVAAPKRASLHAMVEALVESTAAAEAASVLAACGLVDKLALVTMYVDGTEHPNQAVMAADPALALDKMAPALLSLFAVLSRAPNAAAQLPEFHLLQAPKLRAAAVARLAEILAGAYETVYGALTAPKHGYVGVEQAVTHTPAQLRTVCQGL